MLDDDRRSWQLGANGAWRRTEEILAAPVERPLPEAVAQRVVTSLRDTRAVEDCLRLARERSAREVTSATAAVAAAGLAVWNPYVAERLLLGQPPTLLGYAAMPWVALAARSAAPLGWRLPLVLLAAAPAALTWRR